MDAVLFDLDGTLCDYRVSGQVVLRGAFETAGVAPCFTIRDYYGVYERYAGTAETVDAQRAVCFAALAEAAGATAADGRAVAAAYDAARDHRDVVFLDGAAKALESLGADHHLGLVTNGAPGMQGQKLDALGIRDAFGAVVHGGHDAPAKPSPAPFHRALEALGVPPGRAVHVGNSLEADVAGAAAAGVRSVWLRDGSEVGGADAAPDHVVDSLAELVDRPWA